MEETTTTIVQNLITLPEDFTAMFVNMFICNLAILGVLILILFVLFKQRE